MNLIKEICTILFKSEGDPRIRDEILQKIKYVERKEFFSNLFVVLNPLNLKKKL